MPEYAFADEQGNALRVWLPIDEAPEMGSWITHEGKRIKRLVTMPQVGKIDKPFVSVQIRDDHPDVKHWDENHDAVMNNTYEASEFAKRHNERMGGVDLGLDN